MLARVVPEPGTLGAENQCDAGWSKCLAKVGVDVSKVNQTLSIESESKLDLSISQVKLGTVADKTFACN